MYQIERRSHERPMPMRDTPSPLILHMQENRSHLSTEARSAVAALALAMMAAAILPAFEGLLFVPVCALGALALLTFTLEHHARSQPACETLELDGHLLRHRDSRGRATELLARRARLALIGRPETDLRLFLETRDDRIELARCLNQPERQEVAALLRDALHRAAQAGGPAWP